MKQAAASIVVGVLLVIFINPIEAQRPFNDLRARYTPDPSQGFYSIPLTTSSPGIEEYVYTPADPPLRLPLNFYCFPDDPRVCFMYDYNGVVSGVQISYLVNDTANVSPVPYNYATVGGFVYTNLMNMPAYSLRAYFTNPATLTSAGRQILNETVEGLWVVLNNQLIEVDRLEPTQNPTPTGFYRENCWPRMGQHYFYNMRPDMPCSEVLPFYSVYSSGSLVGFGIADFGRGSDGPQRVWYEHPTVAAIQTIVPTRPRCLDTWNAEYGLYSLHVYFVDHSWETTCPGQQSANNSMNHY